MKPRYTIIVCYKNKEFLMVYNPERAWEFPGGKIKQKETARQAAEREFIEETGYKPKNLKKIKQKNHGIIYYSELGGRKTKKSEYTLGYFKKLPKKLSFSTKEYKEILKTTENLPKQTKKQTQTPKNN
ncbi:NUDIX family hydrolase [Methanonatronarchaeum thermophilum]|uniref:NUDIX family hydrolase n=1 Tax=Methanonatronarchaeum thermophilum TaxID=1927129 RepID=A0A1Y3GI16_9EURY|nr:NUDIX domain-containing protein [Methanonatronarchaeum thermophilum]OUJ19075.1 NUDIX family hydrolase [Methanonatronarchaeum thermophilum]